MSASRAPAQVLDHINPAAHDTFEHSEFVWSEAAYWQYYIGLGILLFVAFFAGLLITGCYLWTRYYRDLPELYNSWRRRANNPPAEEELKRELDEYVDMLSHGQQPRPGMKEPTRLAVDGGHFQQHHHEGLDHRRSDHDPAAARARDDGLHEEFCSIKSTDLATSDETVWESSRSKARRKPSVDLSTTISTSSPSLSPSLSPSHLNRYDHLMTLFDSDTGV